MGVIEPGVNFVVSFGASLGSIVWLIRMPKQHRLYEFSINLIAMAIYVFVAFPGDAIF